MTAAVVLVGLGVLLAGKRVPRGFDAASYRFIEIDGRSRRVALGVDWIGEPQGAVVSVFVLALACLWLRSPRLAATVVALPGVLYCLSTGGKHIGARIGDGSAAAYPSGHVAFATALGIVVGVLLAGRSVPSARGGLAIVGAAASAGAVGMTGAQLALWSHSLSECVGGVALALVVVPVLAAVVDRITDRAVIQGIPGRNGARKASAGRIR